LKSENFAGRLHFCQAGGARFVVFNHYVLLTKEAVIVVRVALNLLINLDSKRFDQ